MTELPVQQHEKAATLFCTIMLYWYVNITLPLFRAVVKSVVPTDYLSYL